METTHFALVLALGFVSGMRHALDPDHVVAVSTIVAEHKSIWRSSRVGAFWGIGHTITLGVAGLIVLIFKLTIPERLALGFELAVGVMLVVLGLQLLLRFARERYHIHVHEHGGERHIHLHSHRHGPDHHHEHGWQYEWRSLLIGMVHGLAGSAALTVLLLSSLRSLLHGVLYLATFGIGSVAGMMLISALISSPFAYTAWRFERVNHALRVLAGIMSLGIGLAIIYEMGSQLGG
ncbi:MAG: sulfite exporter TauE/SafE family protein [Blastocatellia bacterium]|nr:sulfite exporter TauE/SafE family protein [Blastocatellia bacterium]MCS7157822.1 sulfite exporter TauE/SafE family protein [Blastocatellia bacterium]MCX7753335.1 sulfite exporter TauE/SafE family protein [Blastocatellia bacterium]MDW8168101.1 sulfite exporter TauE/SafE family protein [Acidobacteriota bacterium]MDW8257650.1 sulfite exporter TauE/SafE family protein [Acidobacteriota bacterium]